MDLRQMGSPYEKKYIELTEEDRAKVTAVYHNWQQEGFEETYENVPEFCYSASYDEVKEKGFTEIVLEGHSYGCNKVVYYYNKKKDERIKKIVLLAPCDIPREGMKFLSKEEYEIAKKESTRLVNEGKGNELVDFSVNANGVISAETYYNDFLPGGVNDFIRYSDDINSKSEVLNSIDIPVLVVFGDIDECVLTQDITTVKNYLDRKSVV